MARKPTLPRGPGRPTKSAPDDRRARILDSAIALFGRDGISATSLSSVARHAHVTPALVHYYYGNREQLVDALVEQRFVPLMREVAAGVDMATEDPRELVRRFVHVVVDAVSRNPWFPPLWVREVLSEGGQLRDRLIAFSRGEVTAKLRDRFVSAHAAGLINRHLDPRLLVVSLMGLTLFPFAAAPIWRRALDGDDIPAQAIAAHAIALLEHGMEPSA
jgi:TetR/AcrR family transcriptional regulator